MGKCYDIKIGDGSRVITVTETDSREIEISGHVYVVPAGVVSFIEDLAQEVETQQTRKTATDAQIEDRIRGRLDGAIRNLAARGLLAQPLDASYPLPEGVETDGGKWTVLDEAREVAREGLKKNALEDLTDIIGGQFGT